MRFLIALSLLGGLIKPNSTGPYGGYYDQLGRWVPGYISNKTWFTTLPRHTYGKATWYGPHVMQGTAAWRGMSLEGYLDGVALMSCAYIGRTVWLNRDLGLGWEGPFLVADCPRRGDAYSAIVYTEEVVEVGWRTAVRWGMVGNKKVIWWLPMHVWIGDQPPEEYQTPAAHVLVDWWLERVEYVNWWEPTPIFRHPGHEACQGMYVSTGKEHNQPCWTWRTN